MRLRILPGKSAEEGRRFLGAYRGVAVVDGYAVHEVLARAGPAVYALAFSPDGETVAIGTVNGLVKFWNV